MKSEIHSIQDERKWNKYHRGFSGTFANICCNMVMGSKRKEIIYK